ncbi:MAG TPA: hypothetical protein VIX85_08130 [Acidimicrobiales bacterium]
MLIHGKLCYWLHKLVDGVIERVIDALDALDASTFADDTVVVFTSDHGDLLGAHGGLVQTFLSSDPEERHPLDAGGETGRALARLLESQRDAKRLAPRYCNPV